MTESMGVTLKKAFDNSSLSIRQLAKSAGVPYSSAFGALERGKQPRMDTYQKMASVLRLQVIRIPEDDTTNQIDPPE